MVGFARKPEVRYAMKHDRCAMTMGGTLDGWSAVTRHWNGF